MNKYTYTAFFQGKKYEFEATSLYEAKLLAISHFKPKKKDMGLLAVVLNKDAGAML